MQGRGNKKVIHVISHLDLGGAEEVAITLTEALSSQLEHVMFAVLTAEDTPVGETYAARLAAVGVPTITGTHLAMKSGAALPAAWKLRALAWRTRPDVIHVHTEVPETVLAVARTLGLPNCRLVRTVHNTNLWPAWRRVGRWVEGRLRDLDAVAVSQGAQEGLWQFQDGCNLQRTPAAQCHVVYNGIRSYGLARRPSPGADSRVRVLFAGRLEEQKGGDLLPAILAAAAPLVDRNIELTVAGSGAQRGGLEAWAASVNAANLRVQVRPPIPNLAAVLSSGEYDLLLMPSRFEGLALVALEALMAGVPVVASRVPGLSEIFWDGYGLLTPANDAPRMGEALAKAIHGLDAYRAEVGARQDWLLARFGVGRMARQYRDIYAGLAPKAEVGLA